MLKFRLIVTCMKGMSTQGEGNYAIQTLDFRR